MGLRVIDIQFVSLFLVAKVGTTTLNLFSFGVKTRSPSSFSSKTQTNLVPAQNPDMAPHFT